ncbi:ABC transporter substrate-binding protein [bacterium]|nr:ABC transporter substrate-binding protein [bacterium]
MIFWQAFDSICPDEDNLKQDSIKPDMIVTKTCSFLCFLFCLSVLAGTEIFAEPKTIAVVTLQNSQVYDEALEGFKESIKNANLDVKYQVFDVSHKDVFSELAGARNDLIYTIGTAATVKTFRSAKDSAIIFSSVLGPLTSDLNGENLAGVYLNIPLLTQLETMKKLTPGLKKIGVLYNPGLNNSTIVEAKSYAVANGQTIVAQQINDYKDIAPKLKDWLLTIDILWIIPDNIVCKQANIQHLLLQAFQAEKPVVGISPEFVKSGALLALTADYKDCGRQAGEIAVAFFKGEQLLQYKETPPRTTHMYLNRKIAQKLGIAISDKLYASATEIYGD